MALNPALMFDFRNQDVTGDFYTYNKRTYDRESREATAARGKVGSGGYTRDEVLGGATSDNILAQDGAVETEKLYHKVQSGETLSSIATKRGVTVDQLCRLNHIRKNMKIRKGMILRYS